MFAYLHRRAAILADTLFRSPSNPDTLLAFEHVSFHTKSVPWQTSADQGRARYSREQQGTVLKRPIMCYIFKQVLQVSMYKSV